MRFSKLRAKNSINLFNSNPELNLLPFLFALTFVLVTPGEAAPILEYKLTEGSGTTVADSSGFGLAANGTLTGGATWSSIAPVGSGFSLDLPGANGDSLNGGNATKLNVLTTISLITWINLQSSPIASDRLLSKANVAGDGFDWAITAPTSGTISTTNYTLSFIGDTTNAVSTANVNQSGWIFLAATYDGSLGSNNVKFYLGTNSSAVFQLGSSVSLNVGTLNTNSANFYVGDTDRTAADRTPDALFDNVRVYNTVESLSSLESIRYADVVPEPSTSSILGFGLAGLFWLRRSKSKRL